MHLNEKNKILSIEAFVGGYFGSSYQVSIDLENNTATYKNLKMVMRLLLIENL